MVEPTPRHVLVFQEAIEFAMSPWWNVDETPPAPPGPATATG
jgi:hypothetical protein